MDAVSRIFLAWILALSLGSLIAEELVFEKAEEVVIKYKAEGLYIKPIRPTLTGTPGKVLVLSKVVAEDSKETLSGGFFQTSRGNSYSIPPAKMPYWSPTPTQDVKPIPVETEVVKPKETATPEKEQPIKEETLVVIPKGTTSETPTQTPTETPTPSPTQTPTQTTTVTPVKAVTKDDGKIVDLGR